MKFAAYASAETPEFIWFPDLMSYFPISKKKDSFPLKVKSFLRKNSNRRIYARAGCKSSGRNFCKTIFV